MLTLRATANVVARHDISEKIWVGVDGRVQEANWAFANGETFFDDLDVWSVTVSLGPWL